MNNQDQNPLENTPLDAPKSVPEEQVIKSEVKPPSPVEDAAPPEESAEPALERLGGEPAPDITPEEFARLQQSGQIHIDPRGRVRSATSTRSDAGVSLRKRRAWYG